VYGLTVDGRLGPGEARFVHQFECRQHRCRSLEALDKIIAQARVGLAVEALQVLDQSSLGRIFADLGSAVGLVLVLGTGCLDRAVGLVLVLGPGGLHGLVLVLGSAGLGGGHGLADGLREDVEQFCHGLAMRGVAPDPADRTGLDRARLRTLVHERQDVGGALELGGGGLGGGLDWRGVIHAIDFRHQLLAESPAQVFQGLRV